MNMMLEYPIIHVHPTKRSLSFSHLKYSQLGWHRQKFTRTSSHKKAKIAQPVAQINLNEVVGKERRPLALKEPCRNGGLGILDFLKSKNILVTGATGFLAKVVIEKILRVQPEVGKLFLFIKAKDSESALHRLKHEVIYSEIFMCLRDVYGNKYEEFILKKLVPVAGDVLLDNLGIQTDMANKLVQQVDIILNSAANTSFDERYDVSLETNTKGPSRLMAFGKRCKQLQLFLHVSTVYVNGQRQGLVLEKPFYMGDSIAKELQNEGAPLLDVFKELDLAKRVIKNMTENGMVKCKSHISTVMKDLALQRARKYGWQDVYVFSKAMGEMLLDHNRGQIPLAIIRPSIIESTYMDPFPGWIQGLRMVDPIIAYYGKGQLHGIVGDPKVPLDIVPVDMVANAILATMAKHAGKPCLEVYHVSSSVANPTFVGDIVGLISEHFKLQPYVNVQGKEMQMKEPLKLFNNMNDLASHIQNIPLNMGNELCSFELYIAPKLIEHINQMVSTYQWYTSYEVKYDNSNTERLLQELSDEERRIFRFNVQNIKWKDYLLNIHIPGVRKHVMKERKTKTMKNVVPYNYNSPPIQVSI